MEIKRCYDTIIGASDVGNQLVQSGATSVTVPNGHKYYSKINGTETLGASTGTAISINDSTKDMVVDLSLLLPSNIVDYVYSLGSTNGIAKLRSWGFLRGYQAHNAGSIESVEVTGKKVVGFNQWDEVWELGVISSSTGENINSSTSIRSKNYIPVVPDAQYYAKTIATLNIRFYDAEKNYIVAGSVTASNGSFSLASGARYIRFFLNSAYGTTYNHDICINLSSDRNGEYEAYVSQSYDYGSDVLNGIFKLDANNNLFADGDRKTSDGLITRKYEIIDLGEQTWNYNSSGAFFYAYLSGYKDNANGSTVVAPNAICNKYIAGGIRGVTLDNADKTFSLGTTNNYSGRILIKDTAYTDATAFKQMLTDQNVKMVYELATPTTEQSTPFPSPQVCYPDGTEEYITSNGVPVGHETKYEL